MKCIYPIAEKIFERQKLSKSINYFSTILLFTLFFLLCFFFFAQAVFAESIELGIDVFLKEHLSLVQKKKIGLLTNHTGINSHLKKTSEIFLDHKEIQLVALFCPEHGLTGKSYAWEKISHNKARKNIPVYSLHGEMRRPTTEMLKEIDVIIYDIQDIGCRSYTYATSLFYMMEECSKRQIPVIVLDRPNPMGGLLIDGPMLQNNFRSFIGYLNVPFCHGMTIGELATYFNEEYKIGCDLLVISMKGWKRWMCYKDTGLQWIPTSPHIPEWDTPLFYACTGVLGELDLVNIGVGYTLPFKLVGAPWIEGETFARILNEQNFEGVKFVPFSFRPFYGSYQGKECEGALIKITDYKAFRPLAVQYLLLGILKSLYPKKIEELIQKTPENKKNLFCKAVGSDIILKTLLSEKYVTWKLMQLEQKEKETFLQKRKKYLFTQYE